jgi:hypothetical protein
VSVEPFHLFRYLDEQSFRFNDRKATDGERFNLAVSQIVGSATAKRVINVLTLRPAVRPAQTHRGSASLPAVKSSHSFPASR